MSKVETDHDCKSDNVSTCRVCAFRENFELIKKITNETTKDLPMTGQMREPHIYGVENIRDTFPHYEFVLLEEYQALQAELAALKVRLDGANKCFGGVVDELATLRAQLANHKEVLKYLHSKGYIAAYNPDMSEVDRNKLKDAVALAKETLELQKKGQGGMKPNTYPTKEDLDKEMKNIEGFMNGEIMVECGKCGTKQSVLLQDCKKCHPQMTTPRAFKGRPK